MKMKRAQALLFFLMMSGSLAAQTPRFLNGSLEPIDPSNLFVCSEDSFFRINNYMGDAWITTVGPEMVYVSDSDCGVGYPKDGKYFLGLHYSPTLRKGNQLLFQLNQPLLAGNTYYFAFYYMGDFPVTGTGATLFSGVVAHPSDSILISDSVALKKTSTMRLTGTTSSWQHAIVSVCPSINTAYIWAAVGKPDNPNDSITIYVDAFSFDTTTQSVNEVYVDKDINVYPNPSHTSAQLELSDRVAIPCQLAIYDINGALLLEKIINNKKYVIDCSAYAKGMYFLKLTDRKNNILTKHLIVE